MSFETLITAEEAIPEVKPLDSYETLRVRDLMRSGMQDDSIPWREMDENAEILYKPDLKVINYFGIYEFKNAKKMMENYTAYMHIYKLEILELGFEKELFNYIKSLGAVNIEIWNLWRGYDCVEEHITFRHLKQSFLKETDLQVNYTENWCISISKD